MSPIQQMLLGVGAVATKTYVDDVFSTYLRKSTGATATVVNKINLSGEGGLVWTKSRSNTFQHVINDSIRGANYILASNNNNASVSGWAGSNTFTSTGYSIAAGDATNNASGYTYVDWSFRKAPGFFSCISYSGSGSYKTVAHDLGCIPGMYMIKRTDTSADWQVFHRDLSTPAHRMHLNSNAVQNDLYSLNNNTAPTASVFSVGSDSTVNASGGSYICYLFAGGESNASEARSVDFDGSGDTLEIPNSSDYSFGSGDFTIEGWYKPDSIGTHTFASVWNYGVNRRSWSVQASSNGEVRFNVSSSGSNNTALEGGNLFVGQWAHFAAVRDGNTLRLFVNGIQVKTSSFTGSIYNNTNDNLFIGSTHGTANTADGMISNLRIVKGTAVYTSSFKPPTTPLTSITNTKLLCCNNSSTTGSTTTSGTITANGDPTASTDSPFDDPAGFAFGDAGDQNVIKCGSHVGNGSSTGPEINLGWEPQWVMVKNTTAGGLWLMADNMRGVVTGEDDPYLQANDTNAEYTTYNWIEFTSTGFKLTNTGVSLNANGHKYVYLCIRRPDGYCGKLPELATDVFAIDTGNGSSDGPAFDSGFPVDMGLRRLPATGNDGTPSTDWATYNRLLGNVFLRANTSAATQTSTRAKWDFNDGFNKIDDSTFQAWMWKRGAGFDCIAYKGNGSSSNRQLAHSLNKAPQMIFIKSRSNAQPWAVYHSSQGAGKYFDGIGTGGISTGNTRFGGVEPTSTHFTLGTSGDVNYDGYTYIAMLFASTNDINGNPISKLGGYTGNGSTTGPVITTGFTPRLILIKRTDTTGHWVLYDSTRGLGATGTDDIVIFLNSANAQIAGYDYFDMVGSGASAGFQHIRADNSLNASGGNYIYYAHA